jgi:hypothetical protein
MKIYLDPIEKASPHIDHISKKIENYYVTGGSAVFFGRSPHDDALVFLFPEFTAICFNDDPYNVDEYESMLSMVVVEDDGRYVEAGVSL